MPIYRYLLCGDCRNVFPNAAGVRSCPRCHMSNLIACDAPMSTEAAMLTFCPAILNDIEISARKMAECWDALTKEKEKIEAERHKLGLQLTEIEGIMRQGHRTSGTLAKDIEHLRNCYDALQRQNASEAARDMRAQGALTKENDELRAEVSRLREYGEQKALRVQGLELEADKFARMGRKVTEERDDLRAQIEGFTAERSTFAVEAQKMREERDEAFKAQGFSATIIGQIHSALDGAKAEPAGGGAVMRVVTLQKERDAARMECSALHAGRDGVVEALDAAGAPVRDAAGNTYAQAMRIRLLAAESAGYKRDLADLQQEIVTVTAQRDVARQGPMPREGQHLHQLLTGASVVTSDGHGRGYDLAERIGMLVQQRDLAFNGQENAQRDAFQYADALKIELDAAKRELDALKNRPPQVNDAGIILCDLVKAKDLHERGDEEAYKKAKDGLWERAFALLGVPMPMHLNCPACGKEHVDKDESSTTIGMTPGQDWTKRLHKTHRCHHCGQEWRPVELCHTVGVRQTKADAPPIGPVPQFVLDARAKRTDLAKAVNSIEAAYGDPVAQILTLLGLEHIVVPPSGPLPQELINALENIELNLEIAANASLTGMTHSLVPKEEAAEMRRAKHILDQIRTLGM